jgi:hypothetical protein
MAKKLTFNPEKPEHASAFEAIFNGFHISARPSSREEHRTTAKILDALEEISIEFPDAVVPGFSETDAAAPRKRVLKPEGGYVVFEEHQYTFLTKALSGITTVAVKSREIEAMWDFIDSAEEGSAKKLSEKSMAAGEGER